MPSEVCEHAHHCCTMLLPITAAQPALFPLASPSQVPCPPTRIHARRAAATGSGTVVAGAHPRLRALRVEGAPCGGNTGQADEVAAEQAQCDAFLQQAAVQQPALSPPHLAPRRLLRAGEAPGGRVVGAGGGGGALAAGGLAEAAVADPGFGALWDIDQGRKWQLGYGQDKKVVQELCDQQSKSQRHKARLGKPEH